MDSNVELFKRKKHELATIVDRWWTHEDIFMDFRGLLNELKALANHCPESFSEQFRLEILEIETALRDDCLID